MPDRVCSTTYLYHYFLQADPDLMEQGLRPLSDFPDSPRWKQIEAAMPGFYENLYRGVVQPIIQKPYRNSGIFLTPIDFYQMGDFFLRPRLNIPVERIDPAWAGISYVIDEQRVTLPFSVENLQKAADIWSESLVRQWFGKDQNRLFFYVPQVVTYQGHVAVEARDRQEIPNPKR